VAITLTKTPAYATYPLTFVKSFNAKPTELIVRTGLGFPSLACDDGATSASPTCGWATDPATGARVPASQGFCCACTLDQAGSDTLGNVGVGTIAVWLGLPLALLLAGGAALCFTVVAWTRAPSVARYD
jgi:hypothetical protein